MTKDKKISRRELLTAVVGVGTGVILTSVGGYITYRRCKEIIEPPYNTSHLVEYMPILKDIILKEGEEYFSFPEYNPKKVESLEEITNKIYPQIKDSINDYTNNKIQYPELHELSYINANSLIYGTFGLGWIGIAHMLQKKLKNEKFKKRFRVWKYLGGLSFIAPAIAHAFLNSGMYNSLNKKVSIDLGNSKESTKMTLAHELGHYLFDKHIDRSYPLWVTEGFACGFAWNVLNNSGLLQEKKSDARKNSLCKLVTTYKLICDKEKLLMELPKEFDEFDFTLAGIRIPDEYSMGYAFFRIKERQSGTDIYRKILNNGNLSIIEPIPIK